ncbi:MAG TPA: AraC family transcriptional regulator [Puia sp.]|jgi:AraC-like DNA-binding protein|nr:AraC family transcriptional regulator [Puia sp.]
MKIQREVVIPGPGQSFRLFAPSLRNYFYWHYHPEYELVYVEATTGIRHVGQHVSGYMESDLVLIGPNIPHLNFDYGLQTEYRQIVVQLKEDFLGNAFAHTPELAGIGDLFGRAAFALSFTGETKRVVASGLKEMQGLSHFEQWIALLRIFQVLADSKEYIRLNAIDTSVKTFLNDKVRMSSVYEYIHARYDRQPDVNEIAAQVHLSTAAFCRYFKRQTNMTFTDFVNQYRISQAKTLLLQDKSVSEAAFAVGIESISYFNKLFRGLTGENPSRFKKKHTHPVDSHSIRR